MSEEEKVEPEKLADQIAKKIIEILGKPKTVKRIRNSQILTALFGTVGFAMFINGMDKLLANVPALSSIIIGAIFMIIAGVFIQKLTK